MTMRNYRTQLEFKNRILEHYESDKDSIIFDGIIDEVKFINAKQKILWILKEPYGDAGFSYADYINKKFIFQKPFPTSGNMWSKIIYINYGILNGFQFWNDIPFLNENQQVFDALKQCALINLSKLPGETSSPDLHIKELYEKNRSLIHEQINFINPEIIICGGTLKFIMEDLPNLKPFIKDDNRAYYYDNKIYINA